MPPNRKRGGLQGGQTILPVSPGNAAYVVLATRTGALTPAGELHYELTRQPRPTLQYDPNQTPVMRGSSTFITGRNGESLKGRYMSADGQLKLTAAGRDFYKQAKEEFLVSEPVIVRGKRRAALCMSDRTCCLSTWRV